MAGRVRFGDEEERQQSESLASHMIEDVAIQHEIVGARVKTIKYVTDQQPPSADLKAIVSHLTIELENGVRVTALNAVLQLPAGSAGFGKALRRENVRQALAALANPEEGALRAAGDAIMQGVEPPELDAAGDPTHVDVEAPEES